MISNLGNRKRRLKSKIKKKTEIDKYNQIVKIIKNILRGKIIKVKKVKKKRLKN